MPAQTPSVGAQPPTTAQGLPPGLIAALAALPGEQPVLALLYDGRRLVDARWTTRAEVTAMLAGSQLAADAEN